MACLEERSIMTIKELKDLIKDSGDTDEIFFYIQDGCCGDTISLELKDQERFNYKDTNNILLTFKYLPGYKTCIQSGGTKREHEEYMKKFNIKEDE